MKEEDPTEENMSSLLEEKVMAASKGPAQTLPRLPLAENKNMGREYGSQWLSYTTRHVHI